MEYEFFRNRDVQKSGRRISEWFVQYGCNACIVQYVRRDKEKEAYWDSPVTLIKYSDEHYIPYKTIPKPLLQKIMEASLNE